MRLHFDEFEFHEQKKLCDLFGQVALTWDWHCRRQFPVEWAPDLWRPRPSLKMPCTTLDLLRTHQRRRHPNDCKCLSQTFSLLSQCVLVQMLHETAGLCESWLKPSQQENWQSEDRMTWHTTISEIFCQNCKASPNWRKFGLTQAVCQPSWNITEKVQVCNSNQSTYSYFLLNTHIHINIYIYTSKYIYIYIYCIYIYTCIYIYIDMYIKYILYIYIYTSIYIYIL